MWASSLIMKLEVSCAVKSGKETQIVEGLTNAALRKYSSKSWFSSQTIIYYFQASSSFALFQRLSFDCYNSEKWRAFCSDLLTFV